MTTMYARNFSNRAELEAHVRSTLGDDITANREAGHQIEGAADELKALNLSESTSVYGVKCVIA